MKKTLLAVALIAISATSYAQAVLGTRNSGDPDGNTLQFMLSDITRAWWLGNGTLHFGDNTDPYSSRDQKIVHTHYDSYYKNESDIFMDRSCKIYSGSSGTYPVSGGFYGYSYLWLEDPGSQNTVLNSVSNHIFIQPDSLQAIVAIGKRVQSPVTLSSLSMLHVNGVTKSKGYVANIKTVTDSIVYVTNSDYTVLCNPAGGVTSVSVILPFDLNTDEGRMFAIKNLSTTATVEISVDNAGTIEGSATYNLSSTNSSVIVQLIGSNTYYILGSH